MIQQERTTQFLKRNQVLQKRRGNITAWYLQLWCFSLWKDGHSKGLGIETVQIALISI